MMISNKEYHDFQQIEIVAMAYLVLLRRQIDVVGRRHWEGVIERNEFKVQDLIDSILSSPEYKMVNAIPFHKMVHAARVEWVRSLGHCDTILDIGGSSANIAQGALIELGYVHRPEEIVIFDLPPDKQYWGLPKFSQDMEYAFSWGKVKYLHGSAEEIDQCKELENKTFDMIYMGQTIEHILPDKLEHLLDWIRVHLKGNGKFIFDTPNRTVTKIQCRDEFIDKTHHKEYELEEMKKIINNKKFIITKITGILPMPQSCMSQIFNPLEVYDHSLLSDDAERCYIYAFECSLSQKL